MAQNIEEFRNSFPVGDLGIIPLQSCSELGKKVNEYIVDWRKEREEVLQSDDKAKDSYIVNTKCSRFGSG
ncbi:MAG: ribose-phosphate pyrophosphokinase, partial [Coprococcus sp.]